MDTIGSHNTNHKRKKPTKKEIKQMVKNMQRTSTIQQKAELYKTKEIEAIEHKLQQHI